MLRSPQNGQNCVWIGQKKNRLSFSSFVTFKNSKKTFPSGTGLKKGFKTKFPHIGKLSNKFWGPCQVKKQNLKVKFWKWGPKTIWHNMPSRVELFYKKVGLLYMLCQSLLGPQFQRFYFLELLLTWRMA